LFSWFLASCGTVSKQSQPLPPDFGLSTSPGTLTIAQGSNGSSTITVAPQNGFTGNVTLAASGLPNGVTASFSTSPTTPTSTMSTLTLTASSTAATNQRHTVVQHEPHDTHTHNEYLDAAGYHHRRDCNVHGHDHPHFPPPPSHRHTDFYDAGRRCHAGLQSFRVAGHPDHRSR